MSNKNVKLRKKLVRLGVSLVVIAIVFAALALVPAFHSADYEIRDNHLTVERTNKHNTKDYIWIFLLNRRIYPRNHQDHHRTAHRLRHTP